MIFKTSSLQQKIKRNAEKGCPIHRGKKGNLIEIFTGDTQTLDLIGKNFNQLS